MIETVKKGKNYSGVVDKVVYGGKGIVKINNFVVLIDKVITGQEIEFQITKLKKNYEKGKLIKILKKASNEIKAKCQHFNLCGGCKWQNLAYKDQLKLKSEQIAEILGKIVNINKILEQIISSPSLWNYRNKLDFSFGYEEMKVEIDDNGNRIYHDLNPCLGFHRPKKFELILPIEHCDIAFEEANQVLSVLQKFLVRHNLTVHNPKTHRGFMRNLVVRKGEKTGEILVNIIVHLEDEISSNQVDIDQEINKETLRFKSETLNQQKGNDQMDTGRRPEEKHFGSSQETLNQHKNQTKVPLEGDTGGVKPQGEQKESVILASSETRKSPESEPQVIKKNTNYQESIQYKDRQEAGKTNQMWLELVDELKQIQGMKGVLLTHNKSMNDAVIDGYSELLWGRDYIYDQIGDLKFKISFASFFQTNTLGAELLYQKVKEYADLSDQENVLDLYCGTGTIGLFLANQAKTVYGIEIVKSAIENARVNAELNNIKNAEFICGNIDKSLHDLLEEVNSQIDVVILDPPRAGVGKKAMQKVVDIKAKKIVYVSCNPTTFARDLEMCLENGYKLKRVQPVDMFPHTYHIEMAAEIVLS